MEILPNLYISDRDFAACPACLSEHAITHVVTVDFVPLTDSKSMLCQLSRHPSFSGPYEIPTKKRHFVPCLDTHSANILAELTDCLDFIDAARKEDGSKVLVHCLVGSSRSAAVTIAYLMRTHTWQLQQAHEFVKSKKPDVCPNWGFVEQLKLFEHLDYQVKENSIMYKALLHELKETLTDPEDGESITDEVIRKHKRKLDEKKIYKCRLCRKFILFESENAVSSHIDQQCTSSFLLEPEEWMYGQMAGDTQGKFSCPKCKAKVGSFNWSGDKCSCGEWMTPALQINLSKVDAFLVE